MTRLRDAFLAGWAPPAASPYFSAVELLAEAERGADVELAKRVGEERERALQQRDSALRWVEEAEGLQRALGVPPLPGPDGAAAYSEWAEAVFASLSPSLGEGSPAAVAHLLGYVLGEAMATLDALAVLSRLRELVPDDLWMRLQGDSLEDERQAAVRRLARLAAHPLLPEPVRTAAALAAHHTAEGAPSGGFAGRATRAEAAARALEEQASAIAAAL